MDRNPDDPKPVRQPDHGFTPRRSARSGAGGKAHLAHDDGSAIEVSILNMSSSGFMAECAAPVRIGSYVSLEVPGIGVVEAQVRWQIGRRMGGMFLDPITLARCKWVADNSDAEMV